MTVEKRLNKIDQTLERHAAAIEKNRRAIEINGAAIEKNRLAILENRAAIEVNRKGILENRAAIEVNRKAIEENRREIQKNGRKIDILGENQAFIIQKLDEFQRENRRMYESTIERLERRTRAFEDRMQTNKVQLSDHETRITVLEDSKPG